MLAETPVHVGSGQSSGVVDLPVARDAVTGHPHIPETGLKGALRQYDEETLKTWVDDIYGPGENASGADRAGEAIFSTGRLILLPIRHRDGPYVWATCPLAIERLSRDLHRIRGQKFEDRVLEIRPDEGKMVTGMGGIPLSAKPPNQSEQVLYLEELHFLRQPPPAHGWTELCTILQSLIACDRARRRLPGQLGVLTDSAFAWLAENSLPVQARNSLDANKISRNLWYEETLPVDSVLYFSVTSRLLQASPAFSRQFVPSLQGYRQVGGNETVGHGWMRLGGMS
jgi:CRISPR-associated protein Cmr4